MTTAGTQRRMRERPNGAELRRGIDRGSSQKEPLARVTSREENTLLYVLHGRAVGDKLARLCRAGF